MPVSVLVIIAVRNRRALVAEALTSLDRQSFRGFEAIAVDDASDDGTGDVLRDCAKTRAWLRKPA